MDDVITISAAEYKAIMGMSAKMAETNAAIQRQNEITQEAVKAMVDNQTALLHTLRELFDAVKITINVPEQGAPVVNLPAVKNRHYDVIREGGVIVGIEEVESE